MFGAQQSVLLSTAAALLLSPSFAVHAEVTHQKNSSKASLSAPAGFFAWNLDESSLLHGLFPDLGRLRSTWEVGPLLSKVSFKQFDRRKRPVAPLDSVPTIFHDRTSLLKSNKDRADPVVSLFHVDSTIEVLNHANVQGNHGSGYKVIKKVVRDGEEFHKSFPKGQQHTTEEITNYFHRGGYSVVINNMQHRWHNIARVDQRLEEELNSMEVYVNLYLTPEVLPGEESSMVTKNGSVRQGFISHWDIMDVIIIQVAGRKRWSVAREPTVYLSNRDMKRKPTKEEVEYYASDNHFLEFTMCPGDALYIPRGHIHNASTVAFDHMRRKWTDWDVCPDYPSEMAGAVPLASALEMPSLHLTFGLESEYTVEALMHHALLAHFADGSRLENRVALPSKNCHGPDGRTTDRDVTWQSVLHHSLAEVARRENDCDNPSYRGINSLKHRIDCDTGILRRLVPLLLLDADVKNLDMARKVDVRLLKQTYLRAVDTFESSSSRSETARFIISHLFRPSEEAPFSYPGMMPEHAIFCPQELNSLSEAEYSRNIEDFVRFAKGNFYKAFKAMNVDGKNMRDIVREQKMLDLEKVGQGGGW